MKALTREKFNSTRDWSSFYNDLQTEGNVPDASCSNVGENNAIFRGMYQNLSTIQDSIRKSGYTPDMITIYADVLVIPDFTAWLLHSGSLVIYARRIEVEGSAKLLIDYQLNNPRLVLFAVEITGTLTVLTSKSSTEQPVIFKITQDNIVPGISIGIADGVPFSQQIQLKQGIAFVLPDDMQLYLNNAFIFGSLLYDQEPKLALSIFLWVKGWAAQTKQFEDLFYRSSSLATLLSSQINAKANGAVFVPYLTAKVYTSLAKAYGDYAAKYESDYMQLSTQQKLTDENIAMAKTMVANAESEISYVKELLILAEDNYNKAVNSAEKAQVNFNDQQRVVDGCAAEFKEIGIPDYERKQVIEAIVSISLEVVSFGGAIAGMFAGDESKGGVAAKDTIEAIKKIAKAAGTTVEVTEKANKLAEVMSTLKKLIEDLEKVFKFAKAIKEVAEKLSSAGEQMDIIQEMNNVSTDSDLSSTDAWDIFKLRADNVLQESVKKEIKFAAEYKEALDILVIYGETLATSQLAVVTTGQEVASVIFQQQYAKQKQENLQKMVDKLKEGEKPLLAMMQQFYQKYLDSKSSLFSALKFYEASYFYWALRHSSVQPKIVDKVSNLTAGIDDITKITMDSTTALEQFNPPPQVMQNVLYEVTDSSILQKLQITGETTWVVPLDDKEFRGFNRVRLNTIRIWLEGISFDSDKNTVQIMITTAGNYRDIYNKTNYQFNSKQLTRMFEYRVTDQGQKQDWEFEDGKLGLVELDGKVDQEVAYAYFQPTPFSEWSISLLKNNPGVDYSNVSKITMYFEGTAIGSTAKARDFLTNNNKKND